MTDFSTEAEVVITPTGLDAARADIEDQLTDEPIQVEVEGGGTRGMARPDGGGAGLSPSRQRRFARREHRWARQRTQHLETATELLDDIEGRVGGGGGGGGGGLAELLGIAGETAGSILGTTAATAIGSTIGNVVADKLSDESVAVDTPDDGLSVDIPEEGVPLAVPENGVPLAVPEDGVELETTTLGYDGPDTLGYDGPSALGYSGPEMLGYDGPGTLGYDGPSALGYSGPEMLGYDGPGTLGYDGPSTVSYDGPSALGVDAPSDGVPLDIPSGGVPVQSPEGGGSGGGGITIEQSARGGDVTTVGGRGGGSAGGHRTTDTTDRGGGYDTELLGPGVGNVGEYLIPGLSAIPELSVGDLAGGVRDTFDINSSDESVGFEHGGGVREQIERARRGGTTGEPATPPPAMNRPVGVVGAPLPNESDSGQTPATPRIDQSVTIDQDARAEIGTISVTVEAAFDELERELERELGDEIDRVERELEQEIRRLKRDIRDGARP
jgi:hypothetical protein